LAGILKVLLICESRPTASVIAVAAVAHACQQSRGGAPIDPFFNVNTPEDAARAEAIALQYPDA